MAANDYSEMPQKKELANKPPKVKTGQMGSEKVSIVYKTASWGLKGAPTQKHDRSRGMQKVSTHGKSEGLGADRVDNASVGNLYGRKHGR